MQGYDNRMKAHKYEIRVYGIFADLNQEIGQKQTIIYVPNGCVFGFRNKEQIDFFSEEIQDYKEAEDVTKIRDQKYKGNVDIPDEQLKQFAKAGRALNNAKERFNKKAKSLLDALK